MDDPPPYSPSQEGASNSQRPSASASAPMMAASVPVMQPGGGRFGGFRTESGFNPCCCCNSCCPGRSLKIGSVIVGILLILLGIGFTTTWISTHDKIQQVNSLDTDFNQDVARITNLMRQTKIYAVNFLLNGLAFSIPCGILLIIAAALNSGLAALIYCILSLLNVLTIIICGIVLLVVMNGFNTPQYYYRDRDNSFSLASTILGISIAVSALFQIYFTLVGVALRSYIKNEIGPRGVMAMGPPIGVYPSDKPANENDDAI